MPERSESAALLTGSFSHKARQQRLPSVHAEDAPRAPAPARFGVRSPVRAQESVRAQMTTAQVQTNHTERAPQTETGKQNYA